MNEIHKKIIITIEAGKFYKFAVERYTIQLKFAAETSKDVSVDVPYSNKL